MSLTMTAPSQSLSLQFADELPSLQFAGELPDVNGSSDTIFLFTSLTSGSSGIVTATSRLDQIFTAHKIPFVAVDVATHQKAKSLWTRRANGRTLPGVVKDGIVLGSFEEVTEWNEYGELKEKLGIAPPSPPARTPSVRSLASIKSAGTRASLKLPAHPLPTTSLFEELAGLSTPFATAVAEAAAIATEKRKSNAFSLSSRASVHSFSLALLINAENEKPAENLPVEVTDNTVEFQKPEAMLIDKPAIAPAETSQVESNMEVVEEATVKDNIEMMQSPEIIITEEQQEETKSSGRKIRSYDESRIRRAAVPASARRVGLGPVAAASDRLSPISGSPMSGKQSIELERKSLEQIETVVATKENAPSITARSVKSSTSKVNKQSREKKRSRGIGEKGKVNHIETKRLKKSTENHKPIATPEPVQGKTSSETKKSDEVRKSDKVKKVELKTQTPKVRVESSTGLRIPPESKKPAGGNNLPKTKDTETKKPFEPKKTIEVKKTVEVKKPAESKKLEPKKPSENQIFESRGMRKFIETAKPYSTKPTETNKTEPKKQTEVINSATKRFEVKSTEAKSTKPKKLDGMKKPTNTKKPPIVGSGVKKTPKTKKPINK